MLPSLETMGVSAPGAAYTTPVSAGGGIGGAAMGITSALLASQAYFGAKAQSYQYKTQQFKYETDAKLAKMNSKNVALQLARQFNNTMASNAVIAAAQGRKGPTVEAVGRSAESQYNWDVDFTELSRDIQARGIESMALSAETAAKTTSKSAISNMLGTAGMNYLQYKMIK